MSNKYFCENCRNDMDQMDVKEKLVDLKPCPFCGGELWRGCAWCVIINNTFAKQYDFCSRDERREENVY